MNQIFSYVFERIQLALQSLSPACTFARVELGSFFYLILHGIFNFLKHVQLIRIMRAKMNLQIEVERQKIEAFCRRWKIIELSFLGSVLREDFRIRRLFLWRDEARLLDMMIAANDAKDWIQ